MDKNSLENKTPFGENYVDLSTILDAFWPYGLTYLWL